MLVVIFPQLPQPCLPLRLLTLRLVYRRDLPLPRTLGLLGLLRLSPLIDRQPLVSPGLVIHGPVLRRHGDHLPIKAEVKERVRLFNLALLLLGSTVLHPLVMSGVSTLHLLTPLVRARV